MIRATVDSDHSWEPGANAADGASIKKVSRATGFELLN
jgi:hypothetical protein